MALSGTESSDAQAGPWQERPARRIKITDDDAGWATVTPEFALLGEGFFAYSAPSDRFRGPPDVNLPE